MTPADAAAIHPPEALGERAAEQRQADLLVIDSKCADVVPIDSVLDDRSVLRNKTVQSIQGAGEWTLR
jgi:hypothetical protein